jgi:hypothetical protein
MMCGSWVDIVLWLMAKVYHRQMTAEEATAAALAALGTPTEKP